MVANQIIPIARGAPSIRVLLIEDSPTHAELIRSQLQEAHQNFDLTHCWRWSEAYKLLQSGRQFDEAILDLTLPDVKTSSDREIVLDLLDRFGLPVTILSGATLSSPKDRNFNQLLKSRNVPFLAKDSLADSNKLIDVLLAQQSERSHRSVQISGELQAVAVKLSKSEVRLESLTDDLEKLEFELYGGTGGYGIKSRIQRVEDRQEHLFQLAAENRRADEEFQRAISAELKSELAAIKEQRHQFRLESHKGRWAIAIAIVTTLVTVFSPYVPKLIKAAAIAKPVVVQPEIKTPQNMR